MDIYLYAQTQSVVDGGEASNLVPVLSFKSAGLYSWATPVYRSYYWSYYVNEIAFYSKSPHLTIMLMTFSCTDQFLIP